jgi:hypothetical protein
MKHFTKCLLAEDDVIAILLDDQQLASETITPVIPSKRLPPSFNTPTSLCTWQLRSVVQLVLAVP